MPRIAGDVTPALTIVVSLACLAPLGACERADRAADEPTPSLAQGGSKADCYGGCPADLVCEGTSGRCFPRTCPDTKHPDRDQDSHEDALCGGDDCDDADPDRFPGRSEQRCDDHDEDCNPCTVAMPGSFQGNDDDADGFVAERCSNPTIGRIRYECGVDVRVELPSKGVGRVYGADCDDDDPAVVPGFQACDGGSVDRKRKVTERSVRLCTPSGRTPPAETRASATSAWQYTSCPADTKCLAQPNGTGACVPTR